MKTLFLDTTILADRYLANAKRQREIKRHLQGKSLTTSNYVIGELKNSFLKSCITLHTLLLDEETVEDALARLGQRCFSTRQFDRILKVFAYLSKQVGYDKEELLERLDILIEDEFEILFVEGIDELVDECRCIRAQAIPVKEGKRWFLDLGCRQQPEPSCGIEEFYAKHAKALSSLAQLEPGNRIIHTDNLKGMLSNQKSKYGRNCWSVGDAIICTEVPADQWIYTSNLKDYGPLSQRLGKKLWAEWEST
ncbi:hypothetical protein [Laceyella putida]|uniref:PIN domain-containing protein n=1 Tax=Laceyella putida TaxID=110101 RepID=A0ABW2RQB6_9BACL